MTAWAVAFSDAGAVWYRHIFKKGFGHCMCLTSMGEGTFMVNHIGYQLSFETSDRSLSDLAAGMVEDGKKVLIFGVEDVEKPLIRPFMTCVSVVQACLGIHIKLAFTPHRLYKALISRGAKELGDG